MKPVCDQRGCCLTDANSVRIGQTHHGGYGPRGMKES
jgi:hypothetical protein